MELERQEQCCEAACRATKEREPGGSSAGSFKMEWEDKDGLDLGTVGKISFGRAGQCYGPVFVPTHTDTYRHCGLLISQFPQQISLQIMRARRLRMRIKSLLKNSVLFKQSNRPDPTLTKPWP